MTEKSSSNWDSVQHRDTPLENLSLNTLQEVGKLSYR